MKIDNKDFASLLKGIKEGYKNGDCSSLARHYYFLQVRNLRLFNAKNTRDKLYRWLFEYTTGYGVKPENTLILVLGLFIFFSMIFISGLIYCKNTNPLWNGLLLSSGSFFTFGAYTDLLRDLPDFFKIFFILESALNNSPKHLYNSSSQFLV